MKRMIYQIIIAVIFISIAAACGYPMDYAPIGFKPVADPGWLSSLYYNPAGLGYLRGLSFLYSQSHKPNLFSRDKSFLFGLGHIAFGIDYLGDKLPYNYHRYNISTGWNYRNILSYGFAYRWIGYSGKGSGKYSQLDLGALFRPDKYLSFGISAQNMNSPKISSGTINPRYTLGVAIKPYKDLITAFGQTSFAKDDDLGRAHSAVGVKLTPKEGISFAFDFSDHKRFGFTVSLNSLFAGVSGYKQINSNGDGIKSITELELHSSARSGIKPYSKAFLKLTIDNDIVEENRNRSRIFNNNRSLLDIIDIIDEAAGDPHIDGILLNIKGIKLGIASVEEIRNRLIEFRNRGKIVVAYADDLSGKDYYLATAADKIFLMPAGYLNLSGLKAEITFFKGLLDKLGIKAEIIAIGKYKSAGDLVSKDSMSTADREQVNEMLDEIFSRMTIDMAAGRNMSVSDMIFTIDSGPFTPEEALENKLIDGLLYQHQIKDELQRLTGLKIKILPSEFYNKCKTISEAWGPKDAIALVYATGGISAGKSSSGGLLTGSICGGETVASAIKNAADDKRVKAIVLRVDSPGGVMTGSEKILAEIKEAKRKKPLIVSMGDVAASGGYHISCWGDVIYADPTTITGSIGVISGKLVVKGLYDKLGIKKEIITRGKNATMFSHYTYPTKSEWERAEKQTRDFYNHFLEAVAKGRGMSVDKVDSLAQGRVWVGSKAVLNGLVDEIGGLYEALQEAKSSAGIGDDYDLIILPKYNGWFSVRDLFSPKLTKTLSLFGIDNIPQEILSGKVLYRMPFDIDIK